MTGEFPTCKACPLGGVLAFLDGLLRHAAPIITDGDPLGGTGEDGYNEGAPWIKFTRTPFVITASA
jgi:hypothetical protein